MKKFSTWPMWKSDFFSLVQPTISRIFWKCMEIFQWPSLMLTHTGISFLNINFSAHFAHIPVPKCAWIAYANQSWSWSHESSWTNRRDITREDCTRFSKGQYINLRIKFSCSHLNQKFNIFFISALRINDSF